MTEPKRKLGRPPGTPNPNGGRKPLRGVPRVSIEIQFDQELLQRIDARAFDAGVSRSEIVNQLLAKVA